MHDMIRENLTTMDNLVAVQGDKDTRTGLPVPPIEQIIYILLLLWVIREIQDT